LRLRGSSYELPSSPRTRSSGQFSTRSSQSRTGQKTQMTMILMPSLSLLVKCTCGT
jgi:hypothetical protein